MALGEPSLRAKRKLQSLGAGGKRELELAAQGPSHSPQIEMKLSLLKPNSRIQFQPDSAVFSAASKLTAFA